MATQVTTDAQLMAGLLRGRKSASLSSAALSGISTAQGVAQDLAVGHGVTPELMESKLRPELTNGLSQALGTDAETVRSNFKAIASGGMPSGGVGTPTDPRKQELIAPIKDQLQKSVQSAVASSSGLNNVSSLALTFGSPNAGMRRDLPGTATYNDYFGKSGMLAATMRKQANGRMTQLGQEIARPFTPGSPAIKGLGDQLAKNVVNPGIQQGIDTHGGGILRVGSRVANLDFGGALDQLGQMFGKDEDGPTSAATGTPPAQPQ